MTGNTSAARTGQAALQLSARAWFAVAAAGQLLFALYIAVFYGGTAARGQMGTWNEVLFTGLVPGDGFGNAVLASHMLLAFVLILGGLAQLVPWVRARYPAIHRWNGRLYVAIAGIISVGGLYLVWTRPLIGGLINQLVMTALALLILLCAGQALRFARARQIARHRRWAIRLFLMMSGVWFFRVMMMFWVLVNGGPVGLGDTLEGPAARALQLAQIALPLGLFQLYLMAEASPSARAKTAMAATLATATLAMAAGIGLAALAMWYPRL